MTTFTDKRASLIPLAQQVLCQGATERPHTGAYTAPVLHGTYLCRRCGLALFAAGSQFQSTCGWPAFDAILPGRTVRALPDADGLRTEVRCSRCEGHLGHVFEGEGCTPANRRYCINSTALDWVASNEVIDSEEALFAGGCFWGVAYYLEKLPGVLKVEAGYTGGHSLHPTYNTVCAGLSGHYETVRVLYDPSKIHYTAVAQRFFEIHDPTQTHGQGPDHGQQYQSAVFYHNDTQKTQATHLLELLKNNGYLTSTRLLPAASFWPAEAYHQNYYTRQQQLPYCHQPVARFKT